jgi:hypothetical protein
LEDDEVYMVARLLGDLMVYRASGTGHLEILAGAFSFLYFYLLFIYFVLYQSGHASFDVSFKFWPSLQSVGSIFH